jgi:hypothetical protein
LLEGAPPADHQHDIDDRSAFEKSTVSQRVIVDLFSKSSVLGRQIFKITVSLWVSRY